MTINKLSLCFVLSISLLSCRRGGSGDAPKVIGVDIDSLSANSVSISELFPSISLICLDDSIPLSNSVYSGASKMDCDGHRLFFLDEKTLAIKVYDMNGKLISSANRKGRGPGEFTMGEMIHYNSDLGLVEILNPIGVVMRYSSDSLLFHSKLDFSGQGPMSAYRMAQVGPDYLIYSLREDDKLWLLKGNGTISSFGYKPPAYLKDYMTAQAPLFEFGGQPYLFNTYDGAFIGIDIESLKVSTSVKWDFGKRQAEIGDIPENRSGREYASFFIEYSKRKMSPFFDMKAHDERIYASVLHEGGKPYSLIYDSGNGHSWFFEKTSEGLHFLPEVFVGDVMYKYVDHENIRSFINPEVLDEFSKNECQRAIDHSLNVVVMYRLKEARHQHL